MHYPAVSLMIFLSNLLLSFSDVSYDQLKTNAATSEKTISVSEKLYRKTFSYLNPCEPNVTFVEKPVN